MKLETERLVIRPFEQADLPEFEKLLEIPEVPGWMMQRGRSADFLAWHISNYEAMDIIRGIVCFGIFFKGDGRILGAVGAGEHDDLHETEIFYNLLPEVRGHGFATEAADAVSEWALANYEIPYIIGTAGSGNRPSQRVLEACGYVFVDERTLLVHIEGQSHRFKLFRRYRST